MRDTYKMTPEEIEALDLKPGQRLELILKSSIDENNNMLPDTQLYPKRVYYVGMKRSEFGLTKLLYHEPTRYPWDPKTPIEGETMLQLIDKIDKIYHLERV